MTKMSKVLPDTDGPRSYLPKCMLNENDSPVIFHDDFGTCNREEVIRESDCVLIQAGIVDTIDDNLLNVNFIKSENNVDNLYHLSSVLSHTYKPSKSMYILGREDKTINVNDWDKEESVIVEEVVEEVCSKSNCMSASNENLELDRNIKMSKKEKYVFSFDSSMDEFFNFDNVLDFTTPKTYSCSKCKILFYRKSSLFHHTCSHDNYFETDISLYENAEYPIICDTIDDSSDQFSSRKNKKSFSWLPKSEVNDEIDEYLEDTIERAVQFRSIPESKHTSDLSFEEIQLTEVPIDSISNDKLSSNKMSGRKLKRSKTRIASPLWLCNICDKPFYTRARLKRHLRTHRDRAIACDECGEKIPDYRALANHRSSHHVSTYRNGVPTTRLFPCYACNKVFGSRSSQQIHFRIHTGERPYPCRFCVKAFADGGTLRKHERIHTGEKPYVCPICKKAFNQRVVLREHIRAYHAGSNANKDDSFTCEVCLEVCSSSCDLCSHLVKHSDDNTAKHRTPLEKPRKYKKCNETTNISFESTFTPNNIADDCTTKKSNTSEHSENSINSNHAGDLIFSTRDKNNKSHLHELKNDIIYMNYTRSYNDEIEASIVEVEPCELPVESTGFMDICLS